MFLITYNGIPARLERIYEAERGAVSGHIETIERESYLAAPTAPKAKALFLHYIGFTWPERAKGIEVARVVPSSLVIQGKGFASEGREALADSLQQLKNRIAAPGILPGHAAPGEN